MKPSNKPVVGPEQHIPKVRALLRRFDEIVSQELTEYSVESLAPRVHIIEPKSQGLRGPGANDVIITISALIHGVEVAGLAVLVQLLELVTRGELRLEGRVGIALGNIPAAEAAVRFVERDLNRSFGRTATETAEDRRADELERLFSRSWRLLDLHQVKLPIDRPFWIFPFTRKGYEFARAVGPDVTLITHWGKGFSQDGKCSDEWVNSLGSTGVTIELGQNGFDPSQVSQGIKIVRRAIEIAMFQAAGGTVARPTGSLAPIYTWGEIVPYPQTGEPVLDIGWHNFKIVKAGERLGCFQGHDIKATTTGPVLFPKYPDPLPDGTYAKSPPAAELVRILREISESDLPA
jgi:hypothetical protein